MPNNVYIVLLCEDHRHAQFVNEFLRGKGRSAYRAFPDGYKGWEAGGIKPNQSFVLERSVQEVKNARTTRRRCALIAVVDGDTYGLIGRLKDINARLQSDGLNALRPEDRVAVVVPCRNIETWVHHFAGNMANEVDDYEKLYPKRGYEADTEAKAFAELVSDGNSPPVLNLPALEAARLELRRLLELMKPE